MSLWTITFRDAATGLGITGLDVDLYSSVGAKVADFSDKGNGSYYVTIPATANYRVKCNGSYVDIYENTHKTTTDVLVASHVDDDTLEFVDIGAGVYNLRIKDGGVTAAKLGSDVAGDGMVQNVGGSLSPNPDGTTIEIDAVTKELKVVDDVFASQSDMTAAEEAIDTITEEIALDFANEDILDEEMTISQNMERLQAAIMEGVAGVGSSGGSNSRVIYSDSASDTSPSGTLEYPIYTIDLATATFKDFLLFPYVKMSGDSYIKVRFEFTMQGNPPTVPAQVKVNVGTSSQTITITSANYNNVYGVYEALIPVSSLNLTGIHDIRIQGGNPDPDNQAYVRKVQALAY